MDAIEVHKKQATMTNTLLHGFVGGLVSGEWEARPVPGANKVGFTVWHLVAVQDWTLRTLIGGALSANLSPEWKSRGMATWPAPFGMSLAEADAVAAATTPAGVLDYGDAILAQSLAWLDNADPSDLDGLPSNPDTHRALHPVYSTEGYLGVAGPMFAYPMWRLVSGACYGHPRAHLGELDLALEIIRAR